MCAGRMLRLGLQHVLMICDIGRAAAFVAPDIAEMDGSNFGAGVLGSYFPNL
jgi:hypothetical protein